MTYIAQFKPFTNGLYVVMHCPNKGERYQISEPQPYHAANDEADKRNKGTWGLPEPEEVVLDFNTITGWTGALSSTP